MKRFILPFLFLLGFASAAIAQRTVSGTITDASGESLIGASVVAQGSSIGTITDIDGNYTLAVPADTEVLEVSYTGYATQLLQLGASNILDVVLKEGVLLDEVVVTSFGIVKEKKSLGYSVTELEKETFELQGESDVSRILSGKVAGVNVNPSGGFLGGSTNVIVRSKGSITGTNQPLYVVDGSPFAGNISDIDPNNILSTSVLKGLAASVLYGQEGRNGVILITTKNGLVGDNDNINVSLSHTVTANQIANLPEYQNTYGNGSDNNTVIGFVGNWGARFDPNVQVPHYYSIGRDATFAEAFPEFQDATVPYVAAPNNVSDFFQTGIGHTTNLNVNAQVGKSVLSFNLGNDTQTGYVDENTYDKINLGAGVLTSINDKLRVKSTINYTNTDTKRPDLGFFDRLTFLPRNLDIHNLPYSNPLDGSSAFYRTDLENPLWQLENQGNRDIRNRLFTTVRVEYDVIEDFTLVYQAGYDNYNEESNNYSNKGGIRGDNLVGWLETSNIRDNSLDQNLQIRMNAKNIDSEGHFSVGALLGGNFRSNSLAFDGTYSTSQLVFGVLDHNNFVSHRPASHGFDDFTVSSLDDFEERYNIFGLYGQLDFALDHWLYLTLSGRNDISSLLEEENRSLFYPSASIAAVISDKLDLPKSIDFLKFRAGYATSAGFPIPYQTRSTLGSVANAFVQPDGTILSTNSVSPFQANPNLKPERSREVELGLDLTMFVNRLSLDFTYFNRRNEDQILFVTRPLSTGFSNSTINAGRIDTRGFEVGLGITPIKNNNFDWKIYSTFTAFENTVKDLPEENLDVFGGLNYAIKDEPLGTFRGSYSLRDDEGRLLIDPTDGTIIGSEDVGLEDAIIGDPNEDWRGSLINTLTYKSFSISAQLEYVSGGDIYSVTTQNLLRRGVTVDTEDREGTYILPGILADPATGEALTDENGATIPNNIQLGANDLYFLNTQDTDDAAIYDATTLRLRQVRLDYKLPDSMFESIGIDRAMISFSANNLWWTTPNLPSGVNVDPEVLGSTLTDRAQGIDFQNDPSYKKFSASLRLNF